MLISASDWANAATKSTIAPTASSIILNPSHRDVSKTMAATWPSTASAGCIGFDGMTCNIILRTAFSGSATRRTTQCPLKSRLSWGWLRPSAVAAGPKAFCANAPASWLISRVRIRD